MLSQKFKMLFNFNFSFSKSGANEWEKNFKFSKKKMQ